MRVSGLRGMLGGLRQSGVAGRCWLRRWKTRTNGVPSMVGSEWGQLGLEGGGDSDW